MHICEQLLEAPSVKEDHRNQPEQEQQEQEQKSSLKFKLALEATYF